MIPQTASSFNRAIFFAAALMLVLVLAVTPFLGRSPDETRIMVALATISTIYVMGIETRERAL